MTKVGFSDFLAKDTYMTILIEVDHTENRNGAQAVASTYNMDDGPLAIPDYIRIGSKSWDNQPITCYDQQVDEYDVWMEDQLKAGNQKVMEALDFIYNKAIQNGIILQTRCVPQPYRTHAHVVKRVIERLAQG